MSSRGLGDVYKRQLYTLFVETVATHRGVSAADVLDHMADGRVFIGQQAINAGLVDGVSTVAEMVERLATNPDSFAQRRKATFALRSAPSPSASAGAAPNDDTPTPKEKGNVMPHDATVSLSLIHISEPTRRHHVSRMPSSA